MKRAHFFKGHFFAGLWVVIPLGVTVWILMAALSAVRGIYRFFPAGWQPEAMLAGQVPFILINVVLTCGLGLLLFFGVSILGWLSTQYLGKIVLEMIGDVIQRIPIVRSVYTALSQLLKGIASGGGQQFSRVVYIEFPRKGIWAIAFVTGPAYGPAVPPRHVNVFMPTTPNPTAGFHLIVPEEEVRETSLKVEEAFKILLSLGIAQTGELSPPHRTM